MPIKFSNGNHIDEEAVSADVIIIEFSKREIDVGQIGDALDRLYSISDNKDFFLKFEGRVDFAFEGYENDPREIYEIPECIKFFRTLSDHWPLWLHFINKKTESFALVLRLLADVEIVASEDGRVGYAFKDPHQLGSVIQKLFDGMNALYEGHQCTEFQIEAMSEKVSKAIDSMFDGS